ncbi:MAG: nicotinate-nicotinamide nucleotide adenylyltransferase [Terriglobia bacterium]
MTPLPSLRFLRRAPQGIAPDAPRPALGVLGGTFNPITRAHLALAQHAQKPFHLNEVLFVLPEQLPHRQPEAAGFDDRVAMLQAALAPCPHFSLGVSTHGLFLDIARALAPHYPPDAHLFFLVGADAAERILLWDYPDRAAALREMFERFDLVVARRQGELRWPEDPHLAPFVARLHALEMPANYQGISASRVREACRKGESLEALVPPAVAAYIRDKNLYLR